VAELDADAVRRLTRDDLLAGLLVLHDLHPDALPERVLAALDAVRPALGAHAGGVELLGIRDEPDGAVVALRLSGSCHGCPSSLVTVRDAIERAILSTAPEVWRIDVEGLAPVAAPGKGEPALLQSPRTGRNAEDGSDCPAVVGAAAGVSG